MNKELRILYLYFLGQSSRVAKIPCKIQHKLNLIAAINKVYPDFFSRHSKQWRGGYSEEEEVVMNVINTFPKQVIRDRFKLRKWFGLKG